MSHFSPIMADVLSSHYWPIIMNIEKNARHNPYQLHADIDA